MLLDTWIIFAAGQLLLLAIGACAVALWRLRAVRRAMDELTERCKAAQVALDEGKTLLEAGTSVRDWKHELTARIDGLDSDAASGEQSPTSAIRRAVLRSELSGETLDLSTYLTADAREDAGSKAELLGLKTANAALEAELATLRAERPATEPAGDDAPVSLARERELKALVQQFTRDSREMLTCIQSLESENRELRAARGAATKSAA